MTTADILARLVSFTAVAGQPNADITDWTADYLQRVGAKVTKIPGPDAGRWNVFASFGPCDTPGIVLSGHLDVVPAQEPEWATDPFTLVERDGKLFGRGTTDMQGYVACVLGLAPRLAALAKKRPIHVALSCDEELGCRGVPSMLAKLPELCALPSGAVIGEPTNLIPVRGHKGKAAYRLEVTGQPGHSSRPDLGLNAIHALAGVLSEIVYHARALEHGPKAMDFSPPYSTMQAGVIAGGQALNIIAARASLQVEARAIPGVDPQALLQPVLEKLDALKAQGFQVHHELLSAYPALQIDRQDTLVELVETSCGNTAVDAVSFGTEAGLFQQAGVPAIICGPGDIGRAHKPNEYITRDELARCTAFLNNLLVTSAA